LENGGYPGPQSTDERGKRHQDQANRERFEKEMENPRERFRWEAAAFERSKRGQRWKLRATGKQRGQYGRLTKRGKTTKISKNVLCNRSLLR
jgi:hypothetical protein